MLSCLQLFGDIGGLYDFLAATVLFFIGRYQSKTFGLHQVKTLFRLPLASDQNQKIGQATRSGFPDVSMREKLFEPIRWGIFQQLRLIYWPRCCPFVNKRDRRLNMITEKGGGKLASQLDTQRLIRV